MPLSATAQRCPIVVGSPPVPFSLKERGFETPRLSNNGCEDSGGRREGRGWEFSAPSACQLQKEVVVVGQGKYTATLKRKEGGGR